MKTLPVIALALLVMLVGCTAKEESSSKGSEEANGTAVQQGAGDSQAIPPADPKAAKADATEPTTEAGTVAKDDGQSAPPSPGTVDSSVVGKYNGKIADETIAMFVGQLPPDQKSKAESDLRATKITLTLAKDGKYTLVTSASHGTSTQTGKWTYEKKDRIVKLGAPDVTEEQIAQAKARGVTDAQIAESQKQTLDCKLSEDGKSMAFTMNQGGMPIGMTFTRA